MKSRMNIVVVTLLVILGCLIWVVIKQRNSNKAISAIPARAIDVAAPAPAMQTPQVPKIEVMIVPPPQPIASAPITPPPVVAPQPPIDRITADGGTRHIAQPGETVTSLANDLLGKDTKTNRDAIINANNSLKADPDKLVAGNAYHIPAPSDVSSANAPAAIQAPAPTPAVKETVASEPPKELKYTAAPGDTVTKMAQAFLGSDTKTHQDAIINANASLKADPDHVVAGTAYRIPAPNGLSAAPAPATETPARPTTQPDADQVLQASAPRTLRYTARPGDTVTTLAIKLLGSDTQETRDAIINNNAALKRNPDRVIAGQTYWIPAPTAAAAAN